MKSSSRELSTTSGSALDERVPFDAGIYFWAFRYALGRMTYAADDVAMALITHRDLLPEGMRKKICREITEAAGTGSLGHDCDARAWLAVRAALSSAKQVEATDPGIPILPPPPTEGR